LVIGIQDVLEVARIGRLRWFGHLERKQKSDWVTRCRFLEVEGKRRRGKPTKTWCEVVTTDMKMLGINSGMALLGGASLGKPSNPVNMGNRR